MSPPRIPYHGPVVVGAQDRDNFVRNLITILYPGWWLEPAWPTGPPAKASGSIKDKDPVLTLPEIKLHCHIELDQTVEDPLLSGFEMAARLHTQRVLRQDIDANVGENVKQAMLLLIAHWYRNREAVVVGTDKATALPLAFHALLSTERAFPPGVY